MGNTSSTSKSGISKYRLLTQQQKEIFITGFTKQFCNKIYPYDITILLSKWLDDRINISFNEKEIDNLMSIKDEIITNTVKCTVVYSDLASVDISITLTENDSFIGMILKFNKLLTTISWLSCYTDIQCIETNSNNKLTKKVKFNEYNDNVIDVDKYYNIIPISKYKKTDPKQLTFNIYIEFIRICVKENNNHNIKYLIPSPILHKNIFYEWIIKVNDKDTLKEDDEIYLSPNFCDDCISCYFEPYNDKFGIRMFKLPTKIKHITANVTFELKDDINGVCIDTFNYKQKIIIFGCYVHWQYFDLTKYLQSTYIKDKLVFNINITIKKVFIDNNQEIDESNWSKYGITKTGADNKYNDLRNGVTLIGMMTNNDEYEENEGITQLSKHETLMGHTKQNDDKAITLMGETLTE